MSHLSALKLWVENYLTGIECSVIGYHDQSGKLISVEYFSTNDALARKYQLKKENFQLHIQTIKNILSEIEIYVERNPEIAKFNLIKVSDRTGFKFVPNDESEFLSESFKERFGDL